MDKPRDKPKRTDEEWELRRLLWLHHGCMEGIYGDDGEMQCNACMLDFVRDDIEKITNRFFVRALGIDDASAKRHMHKLIQDIKEGKDNE